LLSIFYRWRCYAIRIGFDSKRNLSIDRDQAEINPATNDRKRPGARPARKGGAGQLQRGRLPLADRFHRPDQHQHDQSICLYF
jgi:hypothetical protein